MKSGRLRGTLVLAAALCVTPQAWADTLVVTPVALDEQAAPGGGRYILIGDIWIDSLRRVVFTASTTQGKMGLYRRARGQTARLVATGDAAPSGGKFLFLLEASQNSAGDIAFVATTTTPAHIGVYLLRDGRITTLALDNEPAPSQRGESFTGFDQVQINEPGDVYFGATLAAPDGRGIFRADASGIEGVLVPGDFLADREVVQTLQFRANDAGDVAALTLITSHTFLFPPEPIVEELWLHRQGMNRVLAGDFLTASGSDIFLNFAITFNQVSIDESGVVDFYAGTEQHPLGTFFENRAGGFLQNDRLLATQDASPLKPGDLLYALGAFGTDPGGLMVFHAITEQGPARGALFARHNGVTIPVAVAGTPRVGRVGDAPPPLWSGFQTLEMNSSGAFLFTDFQGLYRLALFMGRIVPGTSAVVDSLRQITPTLPLQPADAALLLSRLNSIERYATVDGGAQARALALGLQRAIRSKADGAIPLEAADALDPLLEDLIASLAPSAPAAVPAVTAPARFDRLGIDR